MPEPTRLKVAVCFPSGDMVHADFAMSLASLCMLSAQVLEINIINNKSSIVALARNNGVEMAQAWGANYLFCVDSDMTFPNTTLLKLLAHDKDIIGATYTKRVPPFNALGTIHPDRQTDENGQLLQMVHIPTGCLLIKMGVFDKLSRPYFRFETDEVRGEVRGEDYVFCDRAATAGYQIWCDAGLSGSLGHIGQQIFRIQPQNA